MTTDQATWRQRWHEKKREHKERMREHKDAIRAHGRMMREDAQRLHREHRHEHPQRPTPLQTVKESLHLLLDLPIGIATFTILVTLVSTGLSTLVVIVGFPILLATAFVVRWIANLERARLRWLLDADDLAPAQWPGEGEPFLQRIWTCIKVPTVWKEGFYELALMPWGIATFTITVVLWSVTFAATFFITYFWALPESYPWYEVLGITVGGLVLLVVGPWIVHGIALFGRALSRALLGVSARELTAKVEHLSVSRAQSVDAATAERQ